MNSDEMWGEEAQSWALVLWLNTEPLTKSILPLKDVFTTADYHREAVWDHKKEPVKLVRSFRK